MRNNLIVLLVAFGSAATTEAFRPVPIIPRRVQSAKQRLGRVAPMIMSATGGGETYDAHEFDFVLGEGLRGQDASRTGASGTELRRRTRKVVALPDTSAAARVTLTSSAAATTSSDLSTTYDEEEADSFGVDDGAKSEEGASLSELADALPGSTNYGKQFVKEYNEKYAKYPSISKLWANQDYVGIIWSYMVPGIVGIMATSVVASYGLKAFHEKQDGMLQSYANEMVYHDGDFEEMKMCHSDWKRKMSVFPGRKKKRMISAYLETYARKKPVSPRAIGSLSYVFSVYKLTEKKAAQILVEVAERLKDKPASAGKLLFLGTHILKTQEAKEALEPIRAMLASSYRVGGDMFVANSQKTMGEAAYRSAVAAAGKGQTTLTAGWEVLGLDKETATRIFDEVKEDGFLTGAQKLYGGLEEHKFDEKGRKVDGSGNLLEPEKEGSDEDDEDAPAGTVFECTECGYTMFPAKGREFKFIPDDFTCPECGAAKDKFVDRATESTE